MKLAEKQGLLPARVREPGATYGAAGGPAGTLRTKGRAEILNLPKLALLCSVKCPGKLVAAAYDLAQHLRAAGVTVISGFHSPMEKECLRILIRSQNAIVWCLARGMLSSVPGELRPAVDEGRLLIVSPFPEDVRRVTAETAVARNRVVAGQAVVVAIPHAAPGSKMESLGLEFLSAGKPVYTFDHPGNAGLIASGARVISADADWAAIVTAPA